MANKTLSLCCKVSDRFQAALTEGATVLKDYEGYVPDLMPGNHYGDYIELDIDIETGQILNWKKPTDEQVKKFIEEK